MECRGLTHTTGGSGVPKSMEERLRGGKEQERGDVGICLMVLSLEPERKHFSELGRRQKEVTKSECSLDVNTPDMQGSSGSGVNIFAV